MLARVSKMMVVSAITLTAAVVSLSSVSFAATVPAVSVLSPITKGLRVPVKMAMDAAGNTYVADQRAGGVVKYNVYGEYVGVILTSVAPTGIAFAQDGMLVVCQGAYVARYNVESGVEAGRFVGASLRSASGVAVDDVTGYVYVADSGAKQIVVFNAAGQFVKAFGQGALVSPAGITFEKVARHLVVADTFANSVVFFDVDGNVVKSLSRKIGSTTEILGQGYGPLQYVNPISVAFEYSKSPVALSRMYVLDSYQGMVQVVDPAAGAYLKDIGSVGTANGQLMVPSDVLFDSLANRLMVVNGFGNVTVYGIDGGKSPVHVVPTFTVDQLPADVVVGSVTVSGTVVAGSTVQVTVGGAAVVGTVAYDASGTKWNAMVSGLSYGNNAITISAQNAAPVVASVNYLEPAPAIAITALPQVTNVAKLVVSGTVEAGSTVSVQNVVTSQAATAVVTGGTWTADVLLVEGQNALNVVAQKVGSVKNAVVANVILDTVKPQLTVSALADKSFAGDAVQNISGAVADATAVSVTVNGMAAPLNGNKFSLPVSLVGGANQLAVVASDAAGNSTTDSRTINYIPGGLSVAVDSPNDNSITNVSLVTLSGTMHNAVVVAINGVSAKLQGESWSASVELASGLNTVEVIAKDVDNNVVSVKRTIVYDGSAPALSVASPAQDLATKEPGLLIAGNVADSDTSVVSLAYKFNDKSVELPVNANYAFNVEFSAEGAYPIDVIAKDSVGNTSVVTRNVIYDITPPQFSLESSSGVMPSKIKGNVESGATVVVKDGLTAIGSVQISNGEWSADLTGVNYSPDNLVVIATDAAGNASSKTLTYNFPDGTLNGDGKATVKDAMQAIKLVVNQKAPTAQELSHYDIGPLLGGKPNPNGKIEIVDAILILRKALGLKSW